MAALETSASTRDIRLWLSQRKKKKKILSGAEREKRGKKEDSWTSEWRWVERRWMEGWMVGERMEKTGSVTKWIKTQNQLISQQTKPMNITQRSVHFYWTAPICYGYIFDECNIYKGKKIFFFLQNNEKLAYCFYISTDSSKHLASFHLSILSELSLIRLLTWGLPQWH